jgi:glycosyltransferase involved in cell wall biosynthesis
MPLVSICVPTYNRKSYLAEALHSAVDQTFTDYELVILDDGSTDGTGDLVKSLDRPVRYYWQENAGEVATTNRLIEMAQGKYIAFLHSDDKLMPRALECMVAAAEGESEPVVVYGNYLRMDEHGRISGQSKRKLHSGRITTQLFEDIIVHPNGSLFPKQALQEVGGLDPSLKACYDYKMELRLSLKYRFVAVAEPTFVRRRHASNTSRGSYRNHKIELDVLTDFYYHGGGQGVVPARVAMKRLSKQSLRAGRWALKEGLYEEGRALIRQSFQQRPNLKAMIHLLASSVKRG